MSQPSQNSVSGLVEPIAQLTVRSGNIRNLGAFCQMSPIRDALRTELGWMYNHVLSHIAPERINAIAQLTAKEKDDE